MFDTSVRNLRSEYEGSVKKRDRHLAASGEMQAQYATADYIEGFGPEIPSHENHAFDHVVNTVPALSFYNPKVNVKSRRPAVHREIAKSLKHGLNRWIHDIDLSQELNDIAVDVQFSHGVALVTMESLPGHEHKLMPPLRPAVSRVAPKHFFMDPLASSYRYCRFMGHEWTRDWQDLWDAVEVDPETGKRVAVYDHNVLWAIRTDLRDPNDVLSGRRRDPMDDIDRQLNVPPRNQIRAADIYVPETGMIYTIALDGQGDHIGYLRKPRPYFGPPWGPYILFGIYVMPDQVYPLAPLIVSRALTDELNAHLDQVTDQADQARQFTIVNASNTKAVNAIKTARNGETIAVPGFDASQAMVATIGGPSPQQLDYIDRLRMRLDRKSGVPDFQRGNVNDETATANQLAANASDFRRRYMQRQFTNCVRKLLETVAWYMAESENVVFPMPIPQDDVFGERGDTDVSFVERTPVDGVFFGGRSEGDDFNFFDLEIEIEPMSMELVDELTLQRRMSTFFIWLQNIAQQIVMMPWMNWPQIIDDYAESLNIQDGRRYLNWGLLEQIIGMQLAQYDQAQGVPGTEGTPAPNPRELARGSGVAGKIPGGRPTAQNAEEPLAGNQTGGEIAGVVRAAA